MMLKCYHIKNRSFRILRGNISAVKALVVRVLGSTPAARFEFSLVEADGPRRFFTLEDSPDMTYTAISGTSASELTAGLGFYLREYCNMTIGWPRGGGRSDCC